MAAVIVLVIVAAIVAVIVLVIVAAIVAVIAVVLLKATKKETSYWLIKLNKINARCCLDQLDDCTLAGGSQCHLPVLGSHFFNPDNFSS